jgi:hypothetical protein
MKKIIRLTESDLTRIVKRVVNEQDELPRMGDLSGKELSSGSMYNMDDRYDEEIMNKIANKFQKAKIRKPEMYLYYALELASSRDSDFNPDYLAHYLSKVLNCKLK